MSNDSSPSLVPGQFFLASEPIEINAGRETVELRVRNTGDRAVQIGSHFHFFEVNRAIEFDRPVAYGMRLDIPAGTAVRIEPGQERTVRLVSVGGTKRPFGFNGLVSESDDGNSADIRQGDAAIDRMQARGFRTSSGGEQDEVQ